MKQRGVYQIINTSNGKRYIGSSEHVHRRLYVHRHLLNRGEHHSVALQRAWEKHGPAAFEFSLLEQVPAGESLLLAEQSAIDRFAAAGDAGYNMCPVAGTREGSKQPPSVAVAQSLLMKGKPKSAETRAKMSAAAKGRVMSPEHRAKLAEATRRQMSDPAQRNRISECLRGRKLSADVKKRISDAQRGRPAHPNTLAALAEANRTRVFTDEMRARLAIVNIGRTASAETRAKLSAARLGKKKRPSVNFAHSEEWKRAHSEKLKANWALRKSQLSKDTSHG